MLSSLLNITEAGAIGIGSTFPGVFAPEPPAPSFLRLGMIKTEPRGNQDGELACFFSS